MAPLTSISSSSAIFTSIFGISCPAEPITLLFGRLKAIIGDVSVRPYPSMIGSPNTLKLAETSGSSFAPPETRTLIFPPSSSATFLNTFLLRAKLFTFLQRLKSFLATKLLLIFPIIALCSISHTLGTPIITLIWCFFRANFSASDDSSSKITKNVPKYVGISKVRFNGKI